MNKEHDPEEEDDDEDVESDEQHEAEAGDEDGDEDCESAEQEPERVEYLRSGMVTVVQAQLIDDDLDDGKPPMRLRRLGNGALLRASRHRVLRGAEKRVVYRTDSEESASDARASMRPTGSAGGTKGTLPDFRAEFTQGRSETAPGTSRPTEGSSAADQSSTGEVDLFANWGSVRSDGSQRTRTRPGAFGHECAASDDGSRVSELSGGSRPSVRSSVHRCSVRLRISRQWEQSALLAWVELRSIRAVRRRACRWSVGLFASLVT